MEKYVKSLISTGCQTGRGLLRCLFLVVWMAGFAGTARADVPGYLVLHLNAGGRLYFSLTDVPRLTLAKGTLSLASEHFLISNVKKYTFARALETGISSADSDTGKRWFADSDQGLIYIKGNKARTDIHVYAVDGKELRLPVQHMPDNTSVIDLRTSGPGIYLLKIGDETFKIQWR